MLHVNRVIFSRLAAVSGSTYSYTVGIDRVDASLLCDPNDESIYLGTLMWGIVDGGTLTNPINMSEWSNTLAQETYQLNCPSSRNLSIKMNENALDFENPNVVSIIKFLYAR